MFKKNITYFIVYMVDATRYSFFTTFKDVNTSDSAIIQEAIETHVEEHHQYNHTQTFKKLRIDSIQIISIEYKFLGFRMI